MLIVLLCYACQNKSQQAIYIDPSELPETPVHIKRYGEALFTIDTNRFAEGLKEIQSEYSYFLDANMDDSANIGQLYDFVTDTKTRRLFKESMKVYPDLHNLETSLSDAFSRYQYFYPDNHIPELYTYISDLYYEQPIWIKDTVMVVALDVYLGKDFFLYAYLGLPQYKVRCMTPDYLGVDIMKSIYFKDVWPNPKQKTLLDRMIDGGKLLYFLDAVLPEVHDSVKLCYPEMKLKWAGDNEKQVWAFIIQNELLYTTDFTTQAKLIQDGPFTTGLSNESPARLGQYIGWKIIKAYMAMHPETTLQEMIKQNDAQLILQKSAYKP